MLQREIYSVDAAIHAYNDVLEAEGNADGFVIIVGSGQRKQVDMLTYLETAFNSGARLFELGSQVSCLEDEPISTLVCYVSFDALREYADHRPEGFQSKRGVFNTIQLVMARSRSVVNIFEVHGDMVPEILGHSENENVSFKVTLLGGGDELVLIAVTAKK